MIKCSIDSLKKTVTENRHIAMLRNKDKQSCEEGGSKNNKWFLNIQERLHYLFILKTFFGLGELKFIFSIIVDPSKPLRPIRITQDSKMLLQSTVQSMKLVS